MVWYESYFTCWQKPFCMISILDLDHVNVVDSLKQVTHKAKVYELPLKRVWFIEAVKIWTACFFLDERKSLLSKEQNQKETATSDDWSWSWVTACTKHWGLKSKIKVPQYLLNKDHLANIWAAQLADLGIYKNRGIIGEVRCSFLLIYAPAPYSAVFLLHAPAPAPIKIGFGAVWCGVV